MRIHGGYGEAGPGGTYPRPGWGRRVVFTPGGRI